MFDFSNEEVKKGNVSVFNNGNAGVVDGVTISVEKKGADYKDDGTNQPDYRVLYTDENGTVNTGYYYMNKETYNSTYSTFDEGVHKQWAKLGHIVEELGGDPKLKFDNEKDMLDKMMVLVRNNAVDKSVRVFANYGHVNSPKRFIQIRSWVPFIELSEKESTLTSMNIDQIERLVPDAPGSAPSGKVDTDGWA